ncbi:hypothetical protein CRD60_05630 [Bifidobacterium aemilianum]|uniref:Uncharacterized protein n=1 Tax=Bifidobacterium aemilianum TaxID=2493120 RepID=A0A366K9B1_9BIFI|nr:hypothetical protein CRD60_05630 [Bifidobacterium aemilianum]
MGSRLAGWPGCLGPIRADHSPGWIDTAKINMHIWGIQVITLSTYGRGDIQTELLMRISDLHIRFDNTM